MNKRVALIALPVLILVIGGFVIAWGYWPPLLKYREKRALASYNAEIRRYLDGRDSLDVAAHRLAGVILKLGEIVERQMMLERSPAPGEGSLVAITSPYPSDIPENDPRVEELTLNAFRLARPADFPESAHKQGTQMWDSIIRSRGYRIVP